MINAGKSVEFYLAKDVFVEFNGREINISKSLEHDILQAEDLPWNKRNVKVDMNGVIRISDLDFLGW